MERPARRGWNIVSLTPAVLMLLLIFYFSLQTGDQSTKSSEELGANMSLVIAGIRLTEAQLAIVNSVLRVFAHFLEYALLAVCIAYAATRNAIYSYLRFVYTCGVSLMVSLADEFVQIFVPGRYGDPRDVLVDMCGVLLIAAPLLRFSKKSPLPRPAGLFGKRRAYLQFALDDVGFDEALDRIMDYASRKQEHCRMVVTPNADHVIRLLRDTGFAECYGHADLITADGMPLLWIADSFRCPLPGRVTGADMLPAVCERAAAEGRSIFIVGADEEMLAAAVAKLKESYAGLCIAGTYAPPRGFEADVSVRQSTLKAINAAAPDILVMGLGAPRSEKFIYENRACLKARVALSFGSAVNFISGVQKRAPRWMQRRGLEWFYRFLQEPGRLFKRYFVTDMQIFLLALKYRDRTIAGYLGEDRA